MEHNMKKLFIFIFFISFMNISHAQLSFNNQDNTNTNSNPNIVNLENNPKMKTIVNIVKYNAAISGYAITCKENVDDILQIKTFLFHQLKPLNLNDEDIKSLNDLFAEYQEKIEKEPMDEVACFNFSQQFDKIISTIKNIKN
jgi:hypothetical protein